jgi:hypothetical protein
VAPDPSPDRSLAAEFPLAVGLPRVNEDGSLVEVRVGRPGRHRRERGDAGAAVEQARATLDGCAEETGGGTDQVNTPVTDDTMGEDSVMFAQRYRSGDAFDTGLTMDRVVRVGSAVLRAAHRRLRGGQRVAADRLRLRGHHPGQHPGGRGPDGDLLAIRRCRGRHRRRPAAPRRGAEARPAAALGGPGGRGSWCVRTFSAPDVCTDCDAVRFDRVGVAQIGDRLVLVSLAEVGGPLEPQGLDDTMTALLDRAITVRPPLTRGTEGCPA